MADRNSPIGVFDSGVGGIGTLAALRRELPDERFLFYGDTADAPYGTKSRDEVMACVGRIMDHLLAQDVKAVVITCNTATAVAAAELRARYELPIIGIEPALKPAHEQRRDGSILVLATPMTLKLEKFRALYERYGEGAIPLPCPGLMELVFGVFVGVPNFLCSQYMLRAIERMPAIIAYPGYSVGTIVLVTLAGMAFFREKLSRRQVIALLIIMAALAMLNL